MVAVRVAAVRVVAVQQKGQGSVQAQGGGIVLRTTRRKASVVEGTYLSCGAQAVPLVRPVDAAAHDAAGRVLPAPGAPATAAIHL